MSRRRLANVSEIRQSTIYVDHVRQVAQGRPYAEELHLFTHGVVDVLASMLMHNRMMPTTNTIQPLRRGGGLSKHSYESDWPIFRPRIIATTPSTKQRVLARRHYGYNPEDFDDDARWTDSYKVLGALRLPLRILRAQVTRDPIKVTELATKDPELVDVIEGHTISTASSGMGGRMEMPLSSYRLAAGVVAIGKEVIARECEILDLGDMQPSLELGSLELWRDGTVIRTKPGAAGI